MWVVSSEVGATVPKSIIHNYTHEVRGEIIMTLGLATIGLALTIHTHFRLLMNSSKSLFFEVGHWCVCSSSLDLRVVNKFCTLSVTCSHLPWFRLHFLNLSAMFALGLQWWVWPFSWGPRTEVHPPPPLCCFEWGTWENKRRALARKDL